MSTIHSSPMHFVSPTTIGVAGNVLTQTDSMGNTAFQPPATPVLPPNSVQIFFSKKIGSDVTGDGSYTNPYASINFAYAAAGTPTTPVFITGLDGEVYDEQLVLDSSLKFIIATYANLNWTGAGDAITVLVSGAGFPILFSTISAASGNALSNSSNEVVILEVGSLQSGNVVNSGSGLIIIQSLVTTVDFINTGSGQIFYQVTTRLSGTDTGSVHGISAQGANGPFSIGGYAYPYGGSTTTGYVMTATGPNTLGFAPAAGGSLPFNTIQIFVSQTIGNDANVGSYTNPKATFGAAITLAAAHPGCVIIGLDDATYNENLVINTDLNVSAPLASLIPTAGDAITINDYSFNPTITFKNIRIASGSCLNLSGGGPLGNVYLNATTIDGSAGAAVYNGENGNCYINSEILNGPLLTGGSGNNYYFTKTRSGSDSNQTFGLFPPATGFSSIGVQTFSSAGTYTYTPSAGMSYCVVECVGGGGGAGGVTSSAGSSAASGGGGGGAYAKSVLSAATVGASQTVTVGAGGAGGAAGNNNGTSGGNTSFGALVIADGGGAGFGAIASVTTPSFGIYGAGGGGGVGQILKNGDSGLVGIGWGASQLGIGGQGGNSFYGIGGEQLVNLPGANGFNYGSGGGGAGSGNTGAVAGGSGTDGIVIVTEYIV
jgi:hypothetical protein